MFFVFIAQKAFLYRKHSEKSFLFSQSAGGYDGAEMPGIYFKGPYPDMKCTGSQPHAELPNRFPVVILDSSKIFGRLL